MLSVLLGFMIKDGAAAYGRLCESWHKQSSFGGSGGNFDWESWGNAPHLGFLKVSGCF
jgi:hypothetical protein